MDSRSSRQHEPCSTIVGIDEAGYGPLLGPLVVSAVAFDIPIRIMRELKDRAAGPDLWVLLATSLSPKHRRRDPRLAVADSKKLHGKSGSIAGIHLLERAALAFLNQLGDLPITITALLDQLCPEASDHCPHYPWYADRNISLPVDSDTNDLAVQTSSLKRDLDKTGIRFRGVWSEVLLEGQFNDLVARTHNKAVILFSKTARLIQRVADDVGPRPLRVWIDRQGGRTGYRQPLMNAFEDARLQIVEETSARSSYRLDRPRAPWMVRFVQEGETHHLPIALASIFSKYMRELMMMCFNRYWAKMVSDLRPTAGYYEDGQRFLLEISEAMSQAGIPRDLLVRSL